MNLFLLSSPSLAFPSVERCRFHVKAPEVSVPCHFPGHVGPGHVEDMEGSLANVFPQPLARKAWGRCPAISMRGDLLRSCCKCIKIHPKSMSPQISPPAIFMAMLLPTYSQSKLCYVKLQSDCFLFCKTIISDPWQPLLDDRDQVVS